ncbi:hypothetical protein L2E82_26987 [Cichorium intybus]|uniref:Uncharacterized protein n=1 Tax=Cichorium intybus TaxID=13427 RepID=A0ACB9CRV1_CICIN|nr:hypothetical protein L2E82_26987 [Cichorium intybus]
MAFKTSSPSPTAKKPYVDGFLPPLKTRRPPILNSPFWDYWLEIRGMNALPSSFLWCGSGLCIWRSQVGHVINFRGALKTNASTTFDDVNV